MDRRLRYIKQLTRIVERNYNLTRHRATVNSTFDQYTSESRETRWRKSQRRVKHRPTTHKRETTKRLQNSKDPTTHLGSNEIHDHCENKMRNIMPGYSERARCSFCKRKDNTEITKTEQRMWLECENNGKTLAREATKKIQQKSTPRPCPILSIGLIRGSPALSFGNDFKKDSERLRILLSMTIWAIRKSRDNNTILNQDVTRSETRETLKELLQDLIRKSWNATRFMEGGRKTTRQRELRTRWADKSCAVFDSGLKTGLTVDFS